MRRWITGAFAGWLGVVVLRDLELLGLVQSVPSDLALGVVVIGVIGAYRAALRGRFSRRGELSIYLDASIVFAAVAASLFVLIGDRALEEPVQLSLLLRAVLFFGVLASTAMLDLALLPPLQVRGAYGLLVGLGFLATGYIGRTHLAGASNAWSFTAIIVAGLLIVAFGTATWTDAVDGGQRYARRAQQARDLFPLAAVALVPLVILPAQLVIDDLTLRVVIGASIGLIVVGAIIRQRLLLRDRDRVLDGLRDALGAVEQREDFISAILDSVGAIVIVVGADGRLARYNEATSVVSGYSPAEIDAHGSLDFLVPPEQRLDVLTALGRLQAGEPATAARTNGSARMEAGGTSRGRTPQSATGTSCDTRSPPGSTSPTGRISRTSSRTRRCTMH